MTDVPTRNTIRILMGPTLSLVLTSSLYWQRSRDQEGDSERRKQNQVGVEKEDKEERGQ